MAAAAPPLKLLCLHGYTQSGPLFRAKTRALEKLLLKALPAGTTLTFPTAPHRLLLRDLPGHTPAAENENEGGDDGDDDPSPDNWAWWRRNAATGEYTGLDETWRFLSTLLDTEGPFDGCLGFSQGGALASLLASALEPAHAAARPAALTTRHPPLRFAVVYSGFRAPPALDGLYAPAIATPALHFVGSLDTVVDEARSLALVAGHARDRVRVVYHPGGHYLPAGKQFGGVAVAFVREHVAAGRGGVGVGGVGVGVGVGVEVEEMELPF